MPSSQSLTRCLFESKFPDAYKELETGMKESIANEKADMLEKEAANALLFLSQMASPAANTSGRKQTEIKTPSAEASKYNVTSSSKVSSMQAASATARSPTVEPSQSRPSQQLLMNKKDAGVPNIEEGSACTPNSSLPRMSEVTLNNDTPRDRDSTSHRHVPTLPPKVEATGQKFLIESNKDIVWGKKEAAESSLPPFKIKKLILKVKSPQGSTQKKRRRRRKSSERKAMAASAVGLMVAKQDKPRGPIIIRIPVSSIIGATLPNTTNDSAPVSLTGSKRSASSAEIGSSGLSQVVPPKPKKRRRKAKRRQRHESQE